MDDNTRITATGEPNDSGLSENKLKKLRALQESYTTQPSVPDTMAQQIYNQQPAPDATAQQAYEQPQTPYTPATEPYGQPSQQENISAQEVTPPQDYSAIQGTIPPQDYSAIQGTIPPQDYSAIQGTIPPQDYSAIQGTIPPQDYSAIQGTIPPQDYSAIQGTIPPQYYSAIQGATQGQDYSATQAATSGQPNEQAQTAYAPATESYAQMPQQENIATQEAIPGQDYSATSGQTNEQAQTAYAPATESYAQMPQQENIATQEAIPGQDYSATQGQTNEQPQTAYTPQRETYDQSYLRMFAATKDVVAQTPVGETYGQTPQQENIATQTAPPQQENVTSQEAAPGQDYSATQTATPQQENVTSQEAAPGQDYSATQNDYVKKTRAKKEPRVYRLKRRSFVALVLIMAILCVSAAVGGGYIAAKNLVQAPAPGNNITITPSGDETITEAVAQKVLNSVVGITTTMTTQNFFGQSGEATGEGSGIIVHADGYILTNSHVVGDGTATKIKVLLPDGKEVEGKLLWNDDTIDLAVLKVAQKGLVPVEFGDSDKVKIGAYAAAIGNPLGLEFSGSITQGVVSGLNRSIVASSETKTTRMEGLIQVDAAINPGNSGGPLLNSQGQCIGVNTAKASAEGMGFAIPVNTVKPIVDKVLKTGNFQRAYMGITTSNAEDIKAQYPDLKLGVDKGAFVNEVTISSPADKAGLIMKDVITAVNGKKIETSSELIKELLNFSAGETVEITYVRDGKTAKTKVKLAKQSEVYGTPSQGAVPDDGSQNPNNGSGGSSDGSDWPFNW